MYSRPARERWKSAPVLLFALSSVVALFVILPLVNQINIQRRLQVRGDLGAFAMAPPRHVENGVDALHDFAAPKREAPIAIDGVAAPVEAARPRAKLDALTIPKLDPMAVGPELKRGFVFDASDLDFTPVPIHRVTPVYPQALNLQGIEGRAVVEFRVDESGNVSDIVVIDCTHQEFGEAVVVAVERWRFLPGTISGAPVRFRMRLPVTFNLVERKISAASATLATSN